MVTPIIPAQRALSLYQHPPTRRFIGGSRFSPANKLAHLAAYEQACTTNEGGAYLRREGLYSSQISEWRKQRDAGVLEGASAGALVRKLTPEQAEIARLKRELDKTTKRLATTEVALEIMGKAHALLETLSESAEQPGKPTKR